MFLQGVTSMEKIRMEDAKKMEKQGFSIFHIAWFSADSGYGILHSEDLEKKYPDCSHALVSPNMRWLEKNSVAVVILKGENNEN